MHPPKKSTRPSNLLTIKESQARREQPMTGFGLWRLGFRPFYLGAALLASTAILLWLALLLGTLTLPGNNLSPIFWHAHEMVFGFALAVIAGFLLTASNNWSGILPAAGLPLATLCLIWFSARMAMAMSLLQDQIVLAATLDITFNALLAALLFRVLWMAKLWKNFSLLGIVTILGALNAWFYSTLLSDTPTNPLYLIELALLAIMMLLVIMGGRVIPNFTQNAIRGISLWKPSFFNVATPLATLLGITGWLTAPPRIAFVLCLIAAAINTARWIGWKPWKTFRHPMLCVLQLGYAWIPITLICMGLESLDLAPRSLPVHALAIGAMGLIIAGMITRTAMGHTGRPIIASRIDTTFFLFIGTSAITRALASLPSIQADNWTHPLLITAGTTWALGFLMYAIRYAPWLWRPRIDGRPG